MRNLKVLKAKMIIMVPLSIFLLKVNANTIGYNPDDVKKFGNSSPHSCVQCDLGEWNMLNSSTFKYGVDYSYTNLSGARLDSSNIFNDLSSPLEMTNVQYSDFSNSIAQNAQIGNALTMDFSYSKFDNVRYKGIYLSANILRNATFKGATTVNSSIYINAADYVDFTNADISNSSINPISGICDLVRATFVNTNLANAKITYCDEAEADFTGANLSSASIVNGNLCHAKITPEQIASMKSLSVQ